MPSNVVRFEKLMYIVAALEYLVAALNSERAFDERGVVATIAVQIAFLVIFLLLVWLAARRRQNWARWVLLVLALIALPYFLPTLIDFFRVSALIGLLTAAQWILLAAALYLIFTGNARAWFQGAPIS
jgi:hypothetical protein